MQINLYRITICVSSIKYSKQNRHPFTDHLNLTNQFDNIAPTKKKNKIKQAYDFESKCKPTYRK